MPEPIRDGSGNDHQGHHTDQPRHGLAGEEPQRQRPDILESPRPQHPQRRDGHDPHQRQIHHPLRPQHNDGGRCADAGSSETDEPRRLTSQPCRRDGRRRIAIGVDGDTVDEIRRLSRAQQHAQAHGADDDVGRYEETGDNDRDGETHAASITARYVVVVRRANRYSRARRRESATIGTSRSGGWIASRRSDRPCSNGSRIAAMVTLAMAR